MLSFGAVALGIYWAISTTDYEHAQFYAVVLLLAGALIGLAVVREVAGADWMALIFATAVGYTDRIVRKPFIGSDVLLVTQRAIQALVSGVNPYMHTHVAGIAQPVPFVYPPGELYFYAIGKTFFGQLVEVDRWAGIGIVILLASLALFVGPARAAFATALYATFGLAAFRSLDGSNDTSFAFLLLLAIVLLAFSERSEKGSRALFYASAIIFALALLFKQFASLIYPFVVLYLWRRGAAWYRYAAVSLGVVALICLPFFLGAPSDFLNSMITALGYHENIWGLNLWSGLKPYAPDFIDGLRPMLSLITLFAIVGTAALLVRWHAPNLGGALLQGLMLLFVALYLARWSTSPYYTSAGAILAAAIALFDPEVERRRSKQESSPLGTLNWQFSLSRHYGAVVRPLETKRAYLRRRTRPTRLRPKARRRARASRTIG
ncbi:MAG: hypothetical protein ACR2PL_04985 [Dehalococcoidia bacterium]